VGRRFLRQRPEEIKIRLLVAQSLVNLGRLDEALAELDAVPSEKRTPEVDYALGRIYAGKGERERARQHLVAADRAIPHNAEVLESLLELDRREQQLAQRERAEPGRIASLDQRMAESLARVHAAVEAMPNDARVRQLEGVAAVMEERLDDAEAAFRKAIELDPTERNAYERLARFYAATRRTDQTVEVYEKALELLPDDAGFHHYLGMLYELRGDSERAVARYEDAIRLNPDLAEAKNNLAYIYADRGKNLDRALDLAQDAKTLLPDNPSVSDTLGWVLYKRGVPAAAISYLKEAEANTKEGDASLGLVRHHLALAYEANGDTAEAIAALDRSLAAVQSQSEAIRKQGGDPGPEPAWVSEARSLREKLAGQRQSAATGG
jgi:tetratricopeptide (TPR) repeat protein